LRLRRPCGYARRKNSREAAVQKDRLSSVTGDALDFAGAVALAQEFHNALLLLGGQRVHAKKLYSRVCKPKAPNGSGLLAAVAG